MYCPGKCCSNRQNCENLDGFVTTPRSIYGYGKCRARLFVHKNPLMFKDYVDLTKTDKIRFFLAERRMNLVPNKQLLLNVPFESFKYRKNELCVDNKVQETIRDVFCPTCRNQKCVFHSTNKTNSF